MAIPLEANLMMWDNDRDEPYLILPSFPDLRLTPWRSTDVSGAIELLNEPVIAHYTLLKPSPYTAEDFEHFLNLTKSGLTDTTNSLRPILSDNTELESRGQWTEDQVPFFPFMALRHQPSGKIVGDCLVIQNGTNFWDPKQPGPAIQPQIAKPSDQTWLVGYNIHPDFRGKGIAGEMVDVVVEGRFKFIGIGIIGAFAESRNFASCALLRSRGLSEIGRVMKLWPGERGGGEREMVEWRMEVEGYRSKLSLVDL